MAFTIKQRILLFIFACITSRIGIAMMIKYSSGIWSSILNIIIFIMGMGFMIIYFGGLRKTGVETGGKPIWWNYLRPVHGTLYLLASFLLFYKHKCWSSQIILIDTMVGFSAFLLHHLREKNISLFDM